MLSGETVLVTGGAGFIGRYLTDELIRRGYGVRVLDNLEPQAHPDAPRLSADCELVIGDVADPKMVARSLHGATRIIHLAALVGVGQSMYEAVRYVRANSLGTAVLLEEIARRRDRIERFVVASSMSVYGEGAYECPRCQTAREGRREASALAKGRWEPTCFVCGEELVAVPTQESSPLRPSSIYAITKRDQEEMCLAFGRAYGIPTVALRFFNVYGPGQPLSNPYTGVVAIFAARLVSGLAPLVFEDGGQTRDFVHVTDVARACVAALTTPDLPTGAVNVGTGQPTSISDLANRIRHLLGGPEPIRTFRFRPGDIRHCVADVGLASRVLAWEPRVRLEEGLASMTEWLREQHPPREILDRPLAELRKAGLLQ